MSAGLVAGGLVLFGIEKAVEADEEQREAAKAQKEANRIQTAEQKVKDIRERKQMARQERIRRAQVLQASDTSGTAGGSGQAGALGAMQTIFAANRAASRGSQLTAMNVSMWNQKAADAMTRANTAQALSSLSFQLASMAPTGK